MTKIIGFAGFLIYGCALTANQDSTGYPQMPYFFVENRGQATPEVRYIGEGPDFKAWFLDNAVIFRRGNDVLRFGFADGRKDSSLEPSDPLGAKANYLRGNDPGHWETDLSLFASICYRQVWPGIDVRFRADGSHLKAEYLIAPGASPDSIRLRFDGRVEVGEDGSLVVSAGGGHYREDQPTVLEGVADNYKRVAANFFKFEGGTVGIATRPQDQVKPRVTPIVSGYFGGVAQTTITAVAVNSYYETVVAGWTISTTLPATGGAQSHYAGGVDAFVAAFSPAGGTLLYCTYLGGSGDDRAFGLAVDASNNSYITGWTSSSNFPVSNAYQSKLKGARDAFVTKLNAAGNAFIYSTYLGGSGVDVGYGVAVDSTGAPVIVGDTTSTNLPGTVGVFQSILQGIQNVFVAKLATDGKTLQFLTYFGGNATDHGAAIALDASASIYIGGSTYSSNFPTHLAFQPRSGGGQDGFVAGLSSTGTSLIFSSYYGGSGGTPPGAPEEVNSIAVFAGKITAAGTTSSSDFPITAGVFQPTFGGGATDGFIGRINGTTGALQTSTYLGGSSDDGINAVAVGLDAYTYVAGYTVSTDFPTQNPIQASNGGGMDAFVAKTNLGILYYSTYLGGSGSDSANAIALDSLTSVVVAGSTGSSNFPVASSLGSWQGSALSSFITKIAPPFKATLVSQPLYIYDTWHDTGYSGPTLNLTTSTFGLAGDLPIAGDWDGSGVKRIGIFRNGSWLLDINANGVFDAGDKTVSFGQSGDIPIVGDWNGTGKIKLGLYRHGTFILDLSGHLSGVPTGLSDASFAFGLSIDIPVVSDWNQSGTSKVGVFRNGQWLVDYNGDRVFDGSDRTYTFGQAGDLPVVGDWDGSGLLKIGVFRQGIWILDYEGRNQLGTYSSLALYFTFGGAGYVPLIL